MGRAADGRPDHGCDPRSPLRTALSSTQLRERLLALAVRISVACNDVDRDVPEGRRRAVRDTATERDAAGRNPLPACRCPSAPKVAVLQASNAAVCQRDGDRQYGSLLVGGQGSGKTSVELRMYLNDVHDPNAAVIDSLGSMLVGRRSFHAHDYPD